MALTNDQLDLACKIVGIHKQKLYDTLRYLDESSPRAGFTNAEIDATTDLFSALDAERDARRLNQAG